MFKECVCGVCACVRVRAWVCGVCACVRACVGVACVCVCVCGGGVVGPGKSLCGPHNDGNTCHF